MRRGDLLGPVPGLLDVIVANLPYVAAATVADHPELEREPFAAVFASGDGLDPYRRLVDAAPPATTNATTTTSIHRNTTSRPYTHRALTELALVAVGAVDDRSTSSS